MSAISKLFAAALLVAAGFGIASLLGKPAARLPNYLALQQPHPTARSAAETPQGGMRLVPDFKTVDLDELRSDRQATEDSPQLWSKPDLETVKSAAPPIENSSKQNDPVPAFVASPKAQLRNEAPLALDFESRAAAPFIAQPPLSSAPFSSAAPAAPIVGAATWAEVAPIATAAPSAWPVDQTAMTTYEAARHTPSATPASYNEQGNVAFEPASSITPIAPPPWPAPEQNEGPRKHVIVDGDSLSRLAGRYLNDPHRGTEIFEANRNLLSDPELLPIGAELIIPHRTNPTAGLPKSSQSYSPRAVAIHLPATGGLVPVSPVPAPDTIVPRAQLLRPMPVE